MEIKLIKYQKNNINYYIAESYIIQWTLQKYKEVNIISKIMNITAQYYFKISIFYQVLNVFGFKTPSLFTN